MGERKVLNKYYPPDFDPAKLPKLEIPKDRQYVVRLMAPFTMRCLTCGNYVYKGKKFNSRKETAIGEKYLGIQIYRFYIRCPQCLSEISFKTDPENTDYVVDNGAYRTFQAERIAEMEEERIVQEREEEEANNPMLALENRTKESRREMDVLDALEEIRDWNARNAQVKFEDLMEKHLKSEVQAAEDLDKEDEEFTRKMFNQCQESIKRVEDIAPASKKAKLATDSDCVKPSLKSQLSGMVVKHPKKKEEAKTSLSLLANYSSSEDSS
jgi:rubredoxin